MMIPDHHLTRCAPRRIGRTKGGLNSKIHAVCDGQGRPLVMLLSEGQTNDYKGAALLLSALSKAKAMLGDKCYDAHWFRAALADCGIAACIVSKANRNCRSRTIGPSIVSATRARTNSRTGAASIPATTAVPAP